MGSSIKLDREYEAAMAHLAGGPPQPEFVHVIELRRFTENVLRTVFTIELFPPEVLQESFTVPSAFDGYPVTVTRFYTAAHEGPPPQGRQGHPALVHVHGGGLVSCSVAIFAPAVARIVRDSGVQAFAVDYRLAPEHPFPAGVEDVYAGIAAVASPEAAERFNLDLDNIGLFGDSAGGCLAVGAALMARDRQLGVGVPEGTRERAIAKMILVYPMLDDRTIVEDDHPIRGKTTWGPNDNRLAWDAYLGKGVAGDPDAQVSGYAAPARADSYVGLPPVYIDVGGLDVFLRENIDFVGRLCRDRVDVEFHIFPGVPHGFEGAGDVYACRGAFEGRVHAIKGLLPMEKKRRVAAVVPKPPAKREIVRKRTTPAPVQPQSEGGVNGGGAPADDPKVASVHVENLSLAESAKVEDAAKEAKAEPVVATTT